MREICEREAREKCNARRRKDTRDVWRCKEKEMLRKARRNHRGNVSKRDERDARFDARGDARFDARRDAKGDARGERKCPKRNARERCDLHN
jgi:hypothetical protein